MPVFTQPSYACGALARGFQLVRHASFVGTDQPLVAEGLATQVATECRPGRRYA